MSLQVQTVPPGFGARLREERERLGMTQAALADVAGIKRIAQGQYENEVRSPTVKYLSAVAGAGIDLHYVMFGGRGLQSLGGRRGLEKKAFELVESYARQQPDGQLGAEARYAMFELVRSYMIRCPDGGQELPGRLGELVADVAGD